MPKDAKLINGNTGIQENIECGWKINIGLVSTKSGSSAGHVSNVLDLD